MNATEPNTTPTTQKILIVDDMMDVRLLLRDILEDMGFDEITECSDGAEALNQSKTQHFDLIISDWLMPKLDGIKLVKFLREKSPQRQTPLIMVTSNNQLEDVMAGIEAGVNDYIAKPFESELLQQKIRKVMPM
jgi:two-component system chemotaxis response regulator CheY